MKKLKYFLVFILLCSFSRRLSTENLIRQVRYYGERKLIEIYRAGSQRYETGDGGRVPTVKHIKTVKSINGTLPRPLSQPGSGNLAAGPNETDRVQRDGGMSQ